MTHDRATLAALPDLARRCRAGALAPAEFVARYILQWQLVRHGPRLAQRRSRRDDMPDGVAWLRQLDELPPADVGARLVDLLRRYDLRGVSRRVNIALIAWLRAEWALTLCEQVPDTRTVLRMQIRGERPVTVIADYPRLLEPVHDKPDGFAFVCHDLEHAWQFFHDPARHDAQRRFAAELDNAIERGVFTRYLADPVFAEKFDYLAADMNTHVAHSLQYLRAILLGFHLRAEGKGPREQITSAARATLRQCLENFDVAADVRELLRGGEPTRDPRDGEPPERASA